MAPKTAAQMARQTGLEFSTTCQRGMCGCDHGHATIAGGADLPGLDELAELTGLPVDLLEELDEDARRALVESITDPDTGGSERAGSNRDLGDLVDDHEAYVGAIGVLTRSDAGDSPDGATPPQVVNRPTDQPSADRDVPPIANRPPDGGLEADGELPPSILTAEREGGRSSGDLPPRVMGRQTEAG